MVSAWRVQPTILYSQRIAAEEATTILEFGEALPASRRL